MSWLISPGVYPNIEDLTTRPSAFPTSIGAMVFESPRGSVDPKYLTDRVRWTQEYGRPNVQYGYGGYSGMAFLGQSPSLWGLRVVGTGAKRAMSVFVNDFYYASGAASGAIERTSVHSVTEGTPESYLTTSRSVQDLIFDNDLVSLNSIACTVNTVALTATVFATSNNNTLALLAQKIQTQLDLVHSGSQVFVVERASSPNSQRIIRIITPESYDVTVSATVTLGTSQPIATYQEANWMFFLLAENPGTWGNDLSAQIDSVNTGVPQRRRLTFSAALVALNVVTLVIDGVTISTTFATDSNTTLAALASAITSSAANVTATVIDSGGSGVSSNRELLLVRKNATSDMSITSSTVTLGASQASISSVEVLKRIAPTGTFTFRIFEGENLRNPMEYYNLSMYDIVDGFGNQLNIDHQLNHNSRSRLARVFVNPVYAATSPVPASTTTISLSTGAGFLTGGADGARATSADIVTGWDKFTDVEKITVRILINGGYATPEVQQKMVSISESRRDCFAVLDIPSDSQEPTAAKDYRMNEMNVNSKYAAAYAPDILIFDESSGKRLYVPPSGYVAAQYAYTDRVTAEWFAPAGLIRGLISNALGLRFNYNEGDRDLLSTVQINAIRHTKGSFPIWGEYTLQVMTSALQSVPVVRMLIRIETSLVDAANYFVFEPNTQMTRFRLKTVCVDFLEPIRKAQGLYSYEVVCDERNNTPQTIDARQLIVDVYLKPVLSALYIRINNIVTKTSSIIDELIELRSNPS